VEAIICPSYGPPEVLQIQDVANTTPKADEMLKKIMPPL
jgi:hypothetical protein